MMSSKWAVAKGDTTCSRAASIMGTSSWGWQSAGVCVGYGQAAAHHRVGEPTSALVIVNCIFDSGADKRFQAHIRPKHLFEGLRVLLAEVGAYEVDGVFAGGVLGQHVPCPTRFVGSYVGLVDFLDDLVSQLINAPPNAGGDL